jgi:uncharacterized protein YoxC
MTGVAALIAAISFALLAVISVYVLLRLVRVISDARTLLTEFRGRGDELLARANAAVDRAQAQLDRTDRVTTSMDDLGDGMAELAGHLQAVAAVGRTLAVSPAGKLAALVYGVRHALSLRRGASRTVRGELDRDRGERATGRPGRPGRPDRPDRRELIRGNR